MSDVLTREEILASGVDKEAACHQDMREERHQGEGRLIGDVKAAFKEVVELSEENSALRDEIGRLKIWRLRCAEILTTVRRVLDDRPARFSTTTDEIMEEVYTKLEKTSWFDQPNSAVEIYRDNLETLLTAKHVRESPDEPPERIWLVPTEGGGLDNFWYDQKAKGCMGADGQKTVEYVMKRNQRAAATRRGKKRNHSTKCLSG